MSKQRPGRAAQVLPVNERTHAISDDDGQVGRILHRRAVLALLGIVGAGLIAAGPLARLAALGLPNALAAPASPIVARPTSATCVVKPELTEGPYLSMKG